MDGEDSPWGDEPSRSSSIANSETKKPTEEPTVSSPVKPTASSTLANVRSPNGRSAARGPRGPRRLEAQPSQLESVDDVANPLGPLGDSQPATEEPDPTPMPPVKEAGLPIRQQLRSPAAQDPARSRGSSFARDQSFVPRVGGPGNLQEGGQRPQSNIEDAARPTFDISVGDPHKVGDLTSSHIVYSVRTKTTSKAYKQPEFTVTRRYRDFLWLYTTLHDSNPGVVVPPPPEKQAMGRFDSEFVESRRQALERMLNKIAAHPLLHHDSDLKIFLESEAFSSDVKHREHKEIGLGENKGMLSTLGLGSAVGPKFIEHDDWFHERKIYLDALENQLKGLLKALDAVVSQRKQLAEAAGDFSMSLNALAAVEISPSLSGPLEGLSDLQSRIQQLYSRQAQQDVLTLGITVDEYIRLIGSIKEAFHQRQKSYHSLFAAESELQKRRMTQEKMLRQGKTQQDRLNQLQADVADGERKCHQAKLLCDDMGRLMRTELERFEREKVEDFKSGVETFLEGAVEAQKELIELWESFYSQLEEDEDDEPFLKQTLPPSEPIQPLPRPAQTGEAADGQPEPESHPEQDAAQQSGVEAEGQHEEEA